VGNPTTEPREVRGQMTEERSARYRAQGVPQQSLFPVFAARQVASVFSMSSSRWITMGID